MGWEPIEEALFQIPSDVRLFMEPGFLVTVFLFASFGWFWSTWQLGKLATPLSESERARPMTPLGEVLGILFSSNWERWWSDYRLIFWVIGALSWLCSLLALLPLFWPNLILLSLGISSVWQLLPNGVAQLMQRIRISGWGSVWLTLTVWVVVFIVKIDPRSVMQGMGREHAKGSFEDGKATGDALVEEGTNIQVQGKEKELEQVRSFYLTLYGKKSLPSYVWLNGEEWQIQRSYEISSTEIYFSDDMVGANAHHVTVQTSAPDNPAQSVCLRFDPSDNTLRGPAYPELSNDLRKFTHDKRRKTESVRPGMFFLIETPQKELLTLQFSLEVPNVKGKESSHGISKT